MRFSPDELRQLLASAATNPRDVLSTRSKAYRSRPDELDSLSDDELILAIVDEPTLLRRPLVFSNGELIAGLDWAALERLTNRINSEER